MQLYKLALTLSILTMLTFLVSCSETIEDTTTPQTSETTTESTTAPTTTEDPLLKDEIPPFITIDATEVNVTIRKGGDYDLLQGIRGVDNLEGDITDRI